jgi:sugar transferase (PEP-CTERM system associated)
MLELFRSPRRAAVWFIEGTLLAALVIATAAILIGWDHVEGYGLLSRAIVISVIAQASLYYHGLYGRELLARSSALFIGIARALGVAGIVVWALSHVDPDVKIGAGVSLAALGSAALVLPAWREAFRRVSNSTTFRRSAIVLGSGPLARECATILRQDEEMGLRLAGLLVRDDEPITGPDVIGRYGDLRRIAGRFDVGLVVVAYADRRGAFPAEDLLELKVRGIDVEEGVDFYERMTGKIYVQELRPSQLIFARGFHVRRGALRLKRLLDVVCASAGLVLALPLMAITALAIKLESEGPVLYSQTRTGAFGRDFTIYKFRSMRTDAEVNGARFAEDHDPRITRVGRFIRKTRLDELPQLWNVLVGDMSMVGPRPERPVFIEQLEKQIPFFRQRLCVKPGVTGHAQVRCRYGASTEDHLEKLRHDLFYIKTFSIWFDLSILLDTVKVVLLRIGAR